jgi:hypothetical protein
MYPDAVLQLICLFTVGLSLLLAGGLNALFRSARTFTRLLITLAASALVLVGCWFLTNTLNLLLQAGAILALVLVPSALIGSERAMEWGARLLRSVRRPAVRWGLVSAAGVLLALGSLVAYERQDQRELNESMRDIEEMATAPPLKVSALARARTDRGSQVVLQEPSDPQSDAELGQREQRVLKSTLTQNQIIRHQTASDHTNCHGWVFTGGRYWIGGTEVEAILAENEYKAVEKPQPGDLVVYRDPHGVSHSCIVRYVTEGLPVMVEGKWGTSGVYLHAVDQSLYGSQFTYYRSPRKGHLLAGLDDPPSHDPQRHATSE